MLACQGSPRDKYTDVFFNIGSPDLILPSVPGGRSLSCYAVCLLPAKPFVLLPEFLGESELYPFAVFCQGYFQNSSGSSQTHSRFVFLFTRF